MAHFAQLDPITNKVLQVVVVDNSILINPETHAEEEHRGAKFLYDILGGAWVQTSYNNSFRKRFASIDYIYDPNLDEFIPPDWSFNVDTNQWEAPAPGQIFAQ